MESSPVRQVRREGQRAGRAGPGGQRRAIAAACKRRGWQLLELVEDAGRSANDRKRPGIEQALRMLETGDPKALVAAKQDRLSRSLLDLASLIATAQTQGWALVALDCTLETPPAGEPIANLLA